ncbi:unnamed protein product, partial [Urochloa humidicola]
SGHPSAPSLRTRAAVAAVGEERDRGCDAARFDSVGGELCRQYEVQVEDPPCSDPAQVSCMEHPCSDLARAWLTGIAFV